MYRDIVSCFKKYDTWTQHIFYCKPYCKVQSSADKRALPGFGAQSYQDTISKPSFIAQEKNKDKEIFLNGEVNLLPAKHRNEQLIRRTTLCLKGIMVDNQLGREAIKNYYNLIM